MKQQTQQQEVLNITPYEWTTQIDQSRGAKNYPRTLIVANGAIIANCYQRIKTNKEQAEGNAKAICTAVNETYGKGLNPAAMDELVNVLHNIRRDLEKYGACHRDVLPEIETALQNSKL